VVAGSWACTTRACQNDTPSLDEVSLQLQQPFSISTKSPDLLLDVTTKSVLDWSKAGVDFFLAPVYVCRSPLSTVGLGDTISASGLFYSSMSHKDGQSLSGRS